MIRLEVHNYNWGKSEQLLQLVCILWNWWLLVIINELDW